jgi:hypothetical protein
MQVENDKNKDFKNLKKQEMKEMDVKLANDYI